MKKSLLLILCGLFLTGYSISFAQNFGEGNINTLDQFTSSSSPVSNITQRTYGKAIKITGLSTGLCLMLDSNKILTTTTCGSGSGGVGTSTNPFMATYHVATGTATSTFAGPIKSTCFSIDGTACLTGGGGGSPAGSGTEIQYRNSGSFGALTGSEVSGGNVGLGVTPDAKLHAAITATIDTVASSSVTVDPGLVSNYVTNDNVAYHIYAFNMVAGTKVFSSSYAETNDITFLNDAESANITWEVVTEADGYRIFRTYNYGSFDKYIDVGTTPQYEDDNGFAYTTWIVGDESTVTPTSLPLNSRVSYDTGTDVYNFHSDGDIKTKGLIVDTIATLSGAVNILGTINATNGLTVNTTEHSSADPDDIILTDSAGREVAGLGAWNGGGGATGYGAVIAASHCSSGACRLGEIGGKNTYNTYRLGNLIFQTGGAADTGEIVSLVGTGGGGFGYTQYQTSVGTMFGSGSAPSEMLDVTGNAHISGNLVVDGKVTGTGGFDPPYTLFDANTREEVRARVLYEVPVDKQTGGAQYWNNNLHRMEVYVASEDKYYTVAGTLIAFTPTLTKEQALAMFTKKQRIIELRQKIKENIGEVSNPASTATMKASRLLKRQQMQTELDNLLK